MVLIKNNNNNKRIADPFGEISPEKKLKVLVTGGAGYIGSHTVVELLNDGNYNVVIVDNLCNSSIESVNRVRQITNTDETSLPFYEVDIRDRDNMGKVFETEGPIDFVIHFAGLKSVTESNELPLEYFDVNFSGTMALLAVMDKYDCRKLVFSSSATVYGTAPSPIKEDAPVGFGITNPYGRSKLLVEDALRSLHDSPVGKKWEIVMLRYFNPVGAHHSGLIGESPNGPPNNLMPYVAQVAVGVRPVLTVHGDDWETRDGSGARDFIHVVDLARGHVASLKRLEKVSGTCDVYNLGCGNSITVLEMVGAMEQASQRTIAYKFGPRRAGDLGEVFSCPDLAQKELGWVAEKTVEDMCVDMWRWQSNNPNGYN
jgi:UDP-glucose 4-epimerase